MKYTEVTKNTKPTPTGSVGRLYYSEKTNQLVARIRKTDAEQVGINGGVRILVGEDGTTFKFAPTDDEALGYSTRDKGNYTQFAFRALPEVLEATESFPATLDLVRVNQSSLVYLVS